MGDAGPPTPLLDEQDHFTTINPTIPDQPIRDINVLVTGFGPFKSFATNPSWLIASALSTGLDPVVYSSSELQGRVEDATLQQQQQQQQHPHASHLRNRPYTDEPQQENSQQPIRPSNPLPYRIKIHTHPSPVRVSYPPTAKLIPSLISPEDAPGTVSYDYVLHIGLASGRTSYTLETNGHRDGYTIADTDESNGEAVSTAWQKEGVPGMLEVGWEAQDVLQRWETEVERREAELESAELVRRIAQLGTTTQDVASDEQPVQPPTQTQQGGPVPEPESASAQQQEQEQQQKPQSGGVRSWMAVHGMLRPFYSSSSANDSGSRSGSGSNPRPSPRPPKKAIVKLSRDAGRFLCEFILMCSLIQRWVEAQKDQDHQHTKTGGELTSSFSWPTPAETAVAAPHPHPQTTASERVGKVAFLHVPMGLEEEDVKRGVLVAESAIRAVVGSWEAGWRNPNVYAKGTVKASRDGEGFEVHGTGDC